MNWFDYITRRDEVGDIIPFEKSDRDVEHVDSTTIVERIEMTPELKKAFEDAGYVVEGSDG